jgi:hypothetical protein
MSNQQNEGQEKNRIYKCEFLCGRIATGIIKPAKKLIYTCVIHAVACLIHVIKWSGYRTEFNTAFVSSPLSKT